LVVLEQVLVVQVSSVQAQAQESAEPGPVSEALAYSVTQEVEPESEVLALALEDWVF
jgi:hypothetical protein